MRGLVAFFFLAGVTLLLFCGWGLFTAGGQTAFSEMAGMISFDAGVAGVGCAVLAGAVWLVRRLRSRRPYGAAWALAFTLGTG